ncbi:MAG: HAD family hydrolase [Acetobacter sp.]|nr:HAD family hydrolase [Bacteroides sp.]MCM1341290.1 HAD family hydrolase [Acetobacter sp.]MCM1433934.1 HAD family hydrolase [Clostridiales bacterium]
MKNYDVILFDLDGTLTDSSPGIINSILYALKKYNISVKSTDELRKFLGPPLHDSFREFYGFDDEKAIEAISFYREYFSTKGLLENTVYDGIPKLLQNLKNSGKRLLLATSKPQEFTDRIMNNFDLTKYFEFIAGSNMDGTRSKKAEVIEYALNCCDITDKSNVVMIGDRKHDIIGAETAGIDSIGVEYGYGDYDELCSAGATYIAKTVEDLENLLNNQ